MHPAVIGVIASCCAAFVGMILCNKPDVCCDGCCET